MKILHSFLIPIILLILAVSFGLQNMGYAQTCDIDCEETPPAETTQEVTSPDAVCGTLPTQLSDNFYEDFRPTISGKRVVWSGFDGNDYEIYQWDGNLTSQVTNNTVTDLEPDTDGTNIAWHAWDGNDWEIYSSDGVTTSKITNNTRIDRAPVINGTNIAWSGHEGDYEVFFWDGNTITQLSSNTYFDSNYQIDGNKVVWLSGNSQISVNHRLGWMVSR